MGWVRYFEEKNARAQGDRPERTIAQTEDQIKAVLAKIDRRHEELRSRHG